MGSETDRPLDDEIKRTWRSGGPATTTSAALMDPDTDADPDTRDSDGTDSQDGDTTDTADTTDTTDKSDSAS